MDPRLPPLPSCCYDIQRIILKFMSNEATSHAENPLVDSSLCTQSEVTLQITPSLLFVLHMVGQACWGGLICPLSRPQ